MILVKNVKTKHEMPITLLDKFDNIDEKRSHMCDSSAK